MNHFRNRLGACSSKTGKTGVKYEKTHSLDHEHILSGILRCPLCGSGMYGNVNRKKKKDLDSRWTVYIMDKFYEKKYQDMETRLYRLYDEIEGVENSIEEVKNRLLNIQQQKISEENVYQFLLYFDKLYDKFTDLEKKEFLNSFVEQVDIYEQEQPDGRFLKHIKFRFPVYFGDRETQEICWDNESTVSILKQVQRL